MIANEVARLAATVLAEYAVAARKIKDTKNAPEATADATQQLQRLMPKRFLASTPWSQLPHFARYLKAITLRLDKYRADPARDAAKLAELRPQDQRYWRLVGRTQGRAGRAPAGIPLAAGGTARQLLRAGAAHAAAGQREATGQGVVAAGRMRGSVRLSGRGIFTAPETIHQEEYPVKKASLIAALALLSCSAMAQSVYLMGPDNGPPTCKNWVGDPSSKELYKAWLIGYLSRPGHGQQQGLPAEGRRRDPGPMDGSVIAAANPQRLTSVGALKLSRELRRTKGL